MFCYQKNFFNPTLPVDEAQFYALVRATEWNGRIDQFRETGDQKLKRSLPAFIFQATFDETTSKNGKAGRWRKQAATRLTGLVVMDVDHVDDPRGLVNEKMEMSREKWALLGVLLVYVTPSGKGLKIVFKAREEWGNLIDNQHEMAKVLGVEVDEACKDASRMSFICKESDILFIDKELFTYENKAFAERYNALYRDNHSQATEKKEKIIEKKDEVEGKKVDVVWKGFKIQDIIDARFAEKLPCADDSNRHSSSLKLASDLLLMLDDDAQKVLEIVKTQKWVQEIVNERNEDVEQTIASAQEFNRKKEKKGTLNPYPSDEMQEAIQKVTGKTWKEWITHQSLPVTQHHSADIYTQLPLEEWADELGRMAEKYPCMKELFMNLHPYKRPAVLFSSAALFGTLMTRTWYHFWFDPELVRRLNYCIFIIGDPGCGKNVIEKFYNKITEPMKKADQVMIDAVNQYKDGRTERTTSTKAQKGDALKKPVVGIRVHPARTATGEFIRHMLAAVETIKGQPLNLHMLSFDSELDNATKQNKGGDWKDREIMELKAFHNEEEGQMYANQESVTGLFNVYWNFIYTGTPYALHRKVNQRNFGTGMSTRMAVIPMPDIGIAQRKQEVDPNANETIRTWAYRLDKVEGEMPVEALNNETYEWQSAHLEIADFNDDKADRTLLKRIPYYGIGVSLPYILMRHWDEWQEKRTLTMDDTDRRLCRLAMDIQYRCQQFFFGEMAFNYFADQNKEFVQRRRTTRYEDCFRKLPDEFKTQQFMDCFGVSQQAAWKAMNRFTKEKIIEKVSQGLYKKLVSELP